MIGGYHPDFERLRVNWGDVRFFLAVARDGTLAAAAARLKTTPSRVARHVEALEQALGVALFRRSLDGYRLTDEGRALMPRAEAVEGAVQALGTARSAEVAGRVRLATTENIAVHLLAQPLRDLQRRHPALQVELMVSSSPIDLLSAEVDVALRLVRPQTGNLSVRLVARLAFALYAAPDAPAGFVTWMPEMGDLLCARWVERHGAPVAMRANSLTVQHEMAARGIGRALLPCLLGDADPRLVRLGGVIDEVGQDMWLVINRDLGGSARVRCVADAVADAIAAQRDLLEGRQVAKTG